MELTYDWRGFRDFFYPGKKAKLQESPGGPVYAVAEKDSVISIFAKNEDLSDWIGAPRAEVAEHFKPRETVFIEREMADEWIQKSLGLDHFFNQTQLIREEARNAKVLPKDEDAFEHFLLSGIRGWSGRFLPSNFGFLIRVYSAYDFRDILLLIRRREIHSFQKPDLSSMGDERRRQPEDVVKYLSERHLVPVQGLFVTEEDWEKWTLDSSPWKDILFSIHSKRSRLVPFRWEVMCWMSTRMLSI